MYKEEYDLKLSELNNELENLEKKRKELTQEIDNQINDKTKEKEHFINAYSWEKCFICGTKVNLDSLEKKARKAVRSVYIQSDSFGDSKYQPVSYYEFYSECPCCGNILFKKIVNFTDQPTTQDMLDKFKLDEKKRVLKIKLKLNKLTEEDIDSL